MEMEELHCMTDLNPLPTKLVQKRCAIGKLRSREIPFGTDDVITCKAFYFNCINFYRGFPIQNTRKSTMNNIGYLNTESKNQDLTPQSSPKSS